MRNFLYLPVLLLIISGCDTYSYYKVDGDVVSPDAYENAQTAEKFIDLVLNDPDEAKKLVHEDFTFRYMGKIPIYAQGNVVIKSSYDKEAYFSEFLNVVGQLVPNGIVLTPVDVIANTDSAAVIMVGDAEGTFGEYDNEYVFTYKFKDGKIISVDEYNSDILVARSLYGNTLFPNQSEILIEYVWQTKGPDFSQEKLEDLTAQWNKKIDSMGCQMDGANIITPKEDQENFDFIWMMVWPSEQARDACWSDWLENHDAEWRETISGVWDYSSENAFLFSSEIGRLPKSWSTSDSFTHSYFFCNFNEGSDFNTLHDYRADLNSITTLSDNHWYMLLDPMFDPDPRPDFVWLDIWPTDEARENDLAIWNSTNLPAKAAEMVTCGESIDATMFDGVSIR